MRACGRPWPALQPVTGAPTHGPGTPSMRAWRRLTWSRTWTGQRAAPPTTHGSAAAAEGAVQVLAVIGRAACRTPRSQVACAAWRSVQAGAMVSALIFRELANLP